MRVKDPVPRVNRPVDNSTPHHPKKGGVGGDLLEPSYIAESSISKEIEDRPRFLKESHKAAQC